DPKQSQKLPLSARLAQLDDMEPDDDYRELPIEPTSEELTKLQPPAIRRNITKGAYKDVHNYLDVQFRLLREDFIRPLREGVCLVRSGERGSKDVRVYRGVTFQEAEVIRGVLVHFVKLKLPKNFKVESSKRLLFGNVICFSADNFSSYFLATVAGADPKKLKEGLVGVKLLSQPKIDSSCWYTAVESRAFFVSYKHVLKALQNLNEFILPLAEHIVFAQTVVEAPVYLLNSKVTHYDLRVILNTSYMKAPGKLNHLFTDAETVEPPAGLEYLEAVPILNASVETWPTFAQLGLDQSQRNALQAALTKRLVVIQGPPGTGKTFLGLKITQVLLHNSNAWARKETETRLIKSPNYLRQTTSVEVEVIPPILILCYTNHALDQFLEGMLQFTGEIIRIGSRSKSENIQHYQINEYLRYLKDNRLVPSNVRNAGNRIRNQVSEAEGDLKRQFSQLQEVCANKGLVSWNLLIAHGVIPSTVASQLKSSAVYRSWILPVHQPQCVNEYVYDGREVWSAPVKENVDVNECGQANANQSKEDDDEWHDALEMLRAAESERMVEVEDEVFHKTDSGMSSMKTFEVELSDHKLYQNYLYDNLRTGVFTEEDVRIQWRTFFIEQNYLAKLLEFSEKDVSVARHGTIKDNVQVFDLAFADRCLMYAIWKHKLVAKMREKIRPAEVRLHSLLERAQEVKNSEYLHVARQADVVGLTTTGAAQFQAVVQELKPRIVIIEEAAEILEAHVVASLNSNCEHLIMIGDHQQLKPSPAVYQLGKNYGLDMSLFERMINNGLEYQTLQYQHRMRPEISSLLVPSIYEHLKDHQSVHGRPHIRGVEKSVFFITHKEKEVPESDDNNSHSNEHEAAFIMRLARHLVLQGYSTEQITVLTPYSGQFFLLKK
ncbi:P-loop containing nucleoside triphosphate hydrolase, partial [Trinorchestia longiramus]